CWNENSGKPRPSDYSPCVYLILVRRKSCRVHVHNLQVCYMCIHMPCWCAAPINSSYPLNNSFTAL
uniref:Uncharacterized protein n=1 Tax=Macaca fascicularis TaxID=9541 RepID=A0A7N9D676_MACFA